MKNTPLASVVVPCFNAKNLLPACLASLFSQTYTNFELILVDDHSQDGSPGYAKKLYPKEKRLKIIISSRNRGPSFTRNEGIRSSTGKYVLFFETDMEADPNWIKNLVSVLERDPKIGAAHSRVFDLKRKQYIQADGMLLIPHTGWVVMRNYGKTAKNSDLSMANVVIGSVGTIARKKILNKINRFDEALGHKVDDLDMGWRIWLTGYKTISVPTAISYHWGGKPKNARNISDLKSEIYFHRMPRVFIKNYELTNLIHYLPWLLFLNLLRAVRHLLTGDHVPALAFFNSLYWTIITLPDTLKQRGVIQSQRKITDAQLFSQIMISGSFPAIWSKYVIPTHRIADSQFS